MNKLLILLALFPMAAQAATIKFTWDASAPEQNVTDYRLWRSTSKGGPYTVVGTTPIVGISDVAPNGFEYYYVATARNAIMESGFSNEVFVDLLAPKPPGGIIIKNEGGLSIEIIYD